MSLVLSVFPGIGLLDRAFEEEGFCVVRGPDVLWGGDIRAFHPPVGVFDGVIGGPPCKVFSPINNLNRAKGVSSKFPNLIPEYERIIEETQPMWFLMENVPRAPLPAINGYKVRDLILNNRWLGAEQNRERRFSFGTRDGRTLDAFLDVALFEHPNKEPVVTGSMGLAGLRMDRGKARPVASIERLLTAGRRPISRLCELQGLPSDYLNNAPFTSDGKREVIGNGVPLPMGQAVARAVKRAMAPADREAV